MRLKIILYLALMLISACNEKENEQSTFQKTPITFGEMTSVDTKATDYGFENGDQIGIFIAQWKGGVQNSLNENRNYATNVLYGYSNGLFTALPTLFYPESNDKIDVVAYYPYNQNASGTKLIHQVQNDQSEQSGYTKSDLMYSVVEGLDKSDKPIELKFNHALAKIIIELKFDYIPASIPIVEINNMYNQVELDLNYGKITVDKNSTSSIKMRQINDTRFEAVIAPQQITANGIGFATVTLDGNSYIINTKNDVNFEAGKYETIVVNVSNTPQKRDDKTILMEIFNATNGNQWRNKTNWGTNKPLSAWYGVDATADGRVVGLTLENNMLRGKLPNSIGELSELVKLNIKSENGLSGTIPTTIGNLKKLTRLYIYDTKISGEIPNTICLIKSLEHLTIWRNLVNGEIPQNIGNLNNLYYMDLSDNFITGNIPVSVAKMTSLRNLYLYDNKMKGEVPKEVKKHPNWTQWEPQKYVFPQQDGFGLN